MVSSNLCAWLVTYGLVLICLQGSSGQVHIQHDTNNFFAVAVLGYFSLNVDVLVLLLTRVVIYYFGMVWEESVRLDYEAIGTAVSALHFASEAAAINSSFGNAAAVF